MNYIVDGILALLILIFAIVGCKKGLTGQIGGFLILVGSLVLAFLFYKLIAGYVGGVGFISSIEGSLLSWMNGKGELFTTNMHDAGEEGLRQALSSVNIPGFITNTIIKMIDFDNLPDKTIAEYMAPLMFKYICYAIAFLLIFIVSLIVLSIVIKMLKNLMEKVKVIGFLDKVIGLAIGVAKVTIFIWLVFYGLSMLSTIPAVSDVVSNIVDNYIMTSYIGKFLYENNFVVTLISKMF